MSKARLVITAVTVEKRPVSEVAKSYGVARSWICTLLDRYRAEGETAFEPRSRRPKTSPSAISDDAADLIVRLRKDLAGQGLDAGPAAGLTTVSGSDDAPGRYAGAASYKASRRSSPLTASNTDASTIAPIRAAGGGMAAASSPAINRQVPVGDRIRPRGAGPGHRHCRALD